MRSNEYKARDKTVQKSGRDGLTEVNLHSREAVNISSREHDNELRKVPDDVDYHAGRAHTAGPENEKRAKRHQAALSEGSAWQAAAQEMSGLTAVADAGQTMPVSNTGGTPDTAGAGQEFLGPDDGYMPENGQEFTTETAEPDNYYNDVLQEPDGSDSARGADNEMPDNNPVKETDTGMHGGNRLRESDSRTSVSNSTRTTGGTVFDGTPARGAGNIFSNSRSAQKSDRVTPDAGKCRKNRSDFASEEQNQESRLRHDGSGTVRTGLRQDGSGAARTGLRHDGTHADGGLDETADNPEIEQEISSDGTAKSEMDADGRLVHKKGQKSMQPRSGSRQEKSLRTGNIRERKKRARRKKSIYQKAEENGAPDRFSHSDAGRTDANFTSDDGRNAADKRQRKNGWTADSRDAVFDGGMTAGDYLSDADVTDGDFHSDIGKKDVKFRLGDKGADNVSDSDSGRDSTDGRKGKKQRLFHASQTKAGSEGAQEAGNGSNKSRGRLVFSEKNSGMVLGAGMGIAKHSAHALFHSVKESGSIGSENGDGFGADVEKPHRVRGTGTVVSGLRRTMRLRSFRMNRHRTGAEQAGERLRMEKDTDIGAETHSERASKKKPMKATEEIKKAIRRLQQKKRNKHAYQSMARNRAYMEGWRTAWAVKPESVVDMKHAAGKEARRQFSFLRSNTAVRWALVAVFILFLAGFSLFASCGALTRGLSGIVGTTYPGSDADIRNTENAYLELENALDDQINDIEAAHPGYDEYRYQIDEISHDPYSLASYLTVVYPGYTFEQAEGLLQDVLESQYRLTVEERIETRTDPDTGEEYDWYVLCISLTNRGMDGVASANLTPDQQELYRTYNLTKGNRDYLFAGAAGGGAGGAGGAPGIPVAPAAPGGGVHGVPAEALSDARFANMITEAERYLGYPYVWGGSNPSTSFDCSGYVSWVINNCGNGWSVGRQTAEGLRGVCAYVSPADAKPGDLIFFQGTYNTPGASHVGIYVGNNRMIHCGSPIQYADIGTSYWQLHFMAYGRLP